MDEHVIFALLSEPQTRGTGLEYGIVRVKAGRSISHLHDRQCYIAFGPWAGREDVKSGSSISRLASQDLC